MKKLGEVMRTHIYIVEDLKLKSINHLSKIFMSGPINSDEYFKVKDMVVSNRKSYEPLINNVEVGRNEVLHAVEYCTLHRLRKVSRMEEVSYVNALNNKFIFECVKKYCYC